MKPDLRRIVDIAPLVRSGRLSPVDLVQSCLAQIEARPRVNAFITVLRDRALDEARRAGREIAVARSSYRRPTDVRFEARFHGCRPDHRVQSSKVQVQRGKFHRCAGVVLT